MISASRAGSSRRPVRRGLSSSVKSAMLHSCDTGDGGDEGAPGPLVCGEHAAALRGQPVVPSTALSRLFDPPAIDPATLLEPVEQRIERRDVKLQIPVR